MLLFSNSIQFVKARFIKFIRWLDPRYLGNPKLSVSSLQVFVEGEDPIENRTEIYISANNDE